MCGFVGCISKVRNVNLVDACNEIIHRGPDQQGIEAGDGWSVGFNRLAIIDLTINGMQPFRLDNIIVYLNGEIYNYLELRAQHADEFKPQTESDVEIIPFLYKKFGLDFLNILNGMFAMVILDERTGDSFLVRDRFGKKPLFYKKTEDGLYFASEIKALKKIVDVEIDPVNVALNFQCWFLIQPLTLYKDVFNVEPGSYVAYRIGDELKQSRWYFPVIRAKKFEYKDVKAKFLTLYRRAVQIRLQSDVPVGVFLSGGLDSSSMAYFMHEGNPKNIAAFTADITNKSEFEGNNTDVEIAGKLCEDYSWHRVGKRIDFDYFEKNIISIVCDYDELLLNSGILLFYALAEDAHAAGVKVILTGVGGDEIFGGYAWQSKIKLFPQMLVKWLLIKRVTKFSRWLQSLLIGSKLLFLQRAARLHLLLTQTRVWHATTLGGFFTPHMLDRNTVVAERIEKHSKKYMEYALNSVRNDVFNALNFSNIYTVIGAGNGFIDKACMRWSVENRSPFLDYELFEYMMSLSDFDKTKFGPKGLLRKILREFMPEYVTNAKKSGPTMPVHSWFLVPGIREDFEIFVNANLYLVEKYISPRLANKILNNPKFLYDNASMPAFAILSFLIWAKSNVENLIPDASISLRDFLRM